MEGDVRELTLSEPESARPYLGTPIRSPRRPKYPWIVSLLAVLVGLAAVGWWRLESTVPVDEHEAVMASLSAAEDELAEVTARLDSVSADNDELRNEAESLSAENASLEDDLAGLSSKSDHIEQQLRSVTTMARAVAIMSLWYDPAYLAQFRGEGLDETIASELMADLAINDTYEGWLEWNSWQDVNRIMLQVPDERFQDVWDVYAKAEVGSQEEEIANIHFAWLLARALLETMLELEPHPST